jgi:hypothetical protein
VRVGAQSLVTIRLSGFAILPGEQRRVASRNIPRSTSLSYLLSGSKASTTFRLPSTPARSHDRYPDPSLCSGSCSSSPGSSDECELRRCSPFVRGLNTPGGVLDSSEPWTLSFLGAQGSASTDTAAAVQLGRGSSVRQRSLHRPCHESCRLRPRFSSKLCKFEQSVYFGQCTIQPVRKGSLGLMSIDNIGV